MADAMTSTRRRWIGLGLLGLLTACSTPPATTQPGTDQPLDGVETTEITDRSHVDGEVDYDRFPPLGGPHAPAWVNCGYYDETVPAEYAVHAMEHGAVWITYPTETDEATRTQLQSLTVGQSHLLATESDEVDAITLTAWGVQLVIVDIDDARLSTFVETYLQGPQTPEPGAPCSNGVGEPTA